MKIVETLNEGLKRAYDIKITAKDIEDRVAAEVKKLAPQVNMPGFRKGKVPANLVRKMHNDALMQDALSSSVQEGVQKTIEDNKLRPAMQPSVDLAEGYEPGKDANVKVELEILPDVPTPSVDGIKLERLQVEADKKTVDEALQKFADSQKQFETAAKSYKAAIGDQCLIDFEGKVDGVPFEGGKGEGMAIELGSGRLIPGFEDQLVGKKANDEVLVKVTFPDDYNVEDLKGKDATFDVVIGEVQKPKVAKADDEMAKSMGLEGIDHLSELLKGQIEQELNGLTRTHMKRKLLDQLAASHDFEVPPTMVEAEFNQIWQQLEQEAAQEDDPEAAKKEMEAEKEEYRDIAVRRVRLGLLLSEIGQANGVEVSQQEMGMLIQQAAQQYREEDRQRFVEYIQQDPMAAAQLRAPMYEDKVVDFLFDKAEVTDKKVTREELEAAIEAEDDAETKPAAKKKTPAKKAPAKKAAAKKSADKAAPAKKPVAKKAPAKAVAEKKAPAKKAPAKTAPAKKPAAKKAAVKK
ncbi:trigger factor [Parasphingorhabdus halotolerans]|uniref:Trigger factor n=1 Tax=Parasphingorhabdus halotolerans TaxID=2725558 RepID=A0A6H2DJI7_9SPHN|nr:trigger factor [Parasphingorhabdus halotolerans]QJB68358.1 trigger factor [Parasphingorhabdus halotolerans]